MTVQTVSSASIRTEGRLSLKVWLMLSSATLLLGIVLGMSLASAHPEEPKTLLFLVVSFPLIIALFLAFMLTRSITVHNWKPGSLTIAKIVTPLLIGTGVGLYFGPFI